MVPLHFHDQGLVVFDLEKTQTLQIKATDLTTYQSIKDTLWFF